MSLVAVIFCANSIQEKSKNQRNACPENKEYNIVVHQGRIESMNDFKLIEFDDEEHIFMKLPSFYKGYSDSFIFYQAIKIEMDNINSHYKFEFHIYKEDAKRCGVPILMSRIDKKGRLVLPDDVMKVCSWFDDKLYYIDTGFTDFTLTSQKPEYGIDEEDDYLINLFNANDKR